MSNVIRRVLLTAALAGLATAAHAAGAGDITGDWDAALTKNGHEKQTADAAVPARVAENTDFQHLSDAWTRQP